MNQQPAMPRRRVLPHSCAHGAPWHTAAPAAPSRGTTLTALALATAAWRAKATYLATAVASTVVAIAYAAATITATAMVSARGAIQ